MNKKSFFVVIIFLVVIQADTVYVDQNHPMAHDNNQGTESFPLKNIPTHEEGTYIVIKAGNYPKVNIMRGGTVEQHTTYKAIGNVVVNGFNVRADYIAIDGFNIKSDGNTRMIWRNCGIFIEGNYINILNNYIKNYKGTYGISVWDTKRYGVWGNHINVRNNIVDSCNAGVSIIGDRWHVEGNIISNLIRDPGDYPGTDADFFRFHGDSIVIKNNICYGAKRENVGNSHTDFFQSFYVNNHTATNITIEGNVCLGWSHQGLIARGDPQFKDNRYISHQNIVFRNNIIEGSTTWGIVAHFINNLQVIDNVFILGPAIYGIGFREYTTGIVSGNIVKNCKTGYPADATTTMIKNDNIHIPGEIIE